MLHNTLNVSYPQSTMGLTCRWEILLIGLWIQVSIVPGIHCNNGTANHLSREDVLLLKGGQELKCFTRTEKDFTCFFETADKRDYEFIYKVESLHTEKRCRLSVQRTEEGTFLHICSFPPLDVFLYVEMHLEVVERNTNISLYNRTVSVEDLLLLDPPFNVSLNQNGQAGQLQISWHANIQKYWTEKVMYRILYSSKGLGEKMKEARDGEILDSLVPGEEVEVKVTVKCASDPNAGHWSSWSHPVRAVVPQNADDISLTCYTSDLQNISCQWNESRYSEGFKLFYKTDRSEVGSWTEWTECLADRSLTGLCRFCGDKSRNFRVKLSSTSSAFSRTFYSQEFTLSKSIKTSPPRHVRGVLEKEKLCLKWEAPLPSLSAHLQYAVSYKIRADGWMTVYLQSPKTSTCLEVPAGSRYSVKLRTKPDGSTYSGQWSEWSHVLTGDTPADIGTLLLLCIPFLMLMIAILLLFLFTKYLSKLKQYFWPPVPDLDKVLQGFLLDINGSRWNPPITAKQLSEETTSSLVEIMSDGFSSSENSSEESTQPLSQERHSCSREEVDGSHATQGFPDYVTLNKDSVVLCSKGNKHVYEEVGEKDGVEVRDELLQTCNPPCTDSSPCLSGDFLNHSYLPLAEPADKFSCKVTVTRGPGNLYTNFPCG